MNMNFLPCASFNSKNKNAQDWSTIFNNKYPLAWSRTIKSRPCGSIYMAAIHGNTVNEEHNDNNEMQVVHEELQHHLEYGADEYYNGFFGIYDSGSGRKNEASLHLKQYLFEELKKLIGENGNHMSEDIMKRAFSNVEESFMQFVIDSSKNNQTDIQDGSCCIAILIWEDTLYIANLGDSRAVLGTKVGVSRFKRLLVEQLTNDHSLSNEDIRADLKALNPHDTDVVQCSEGIWKNKNNIKVNRSIGYYRLKDHPLNSVLPSSHLVPELESNERVQVLVSAEPELHSRKFRDGDRFLILASHGFWNFMTNKNAANIVNRNPPDEIAKRLLSAALKEATEKIGAKGVYDDMFIIVLLINKNKWWNDTPKTVALHKEPSYLNNIIMASGKSDQFIQNSQPSVPTNAQRRSGSSTGRELDIQVVTNAIENLMKPYTLQSNDGEGSSTHQLRQEDAISKNIEIKKMLQGMQQVLKYVQQQLLPVSAIQELEMIGKIVKLAKGELMVEMEKSIFGHLFSDFIDGNLMIEVAQRDLLSISSMTFYVRYLHDEIIRPQQLFNNFAFLIPYTMHMLVVKPYEELGEEEKKNIATLFLESKDKLILAPCNLSQHWVLIVIKVNADTIYYMDSLNSDPKNYTNLIPNFQKIFEVYRKESEVVPNSKNVIWKIPKCPKQPNDIDCGYYVMKFMKDIIKKSPNEIPVDYVPEIEGDRYSNEALDEVKMDWASYLINIIKTTKSSTADEEHD